VPTDEGGDVETSVLELPAPSATRLRRPGWRDPRLLAGVAMVAASVALGAWVVRSAQGTVPVYAARRAIVAGDEVRTSDLAVVQVRGVDLDRYVPADRPFDDVVAVRTIGAGELVPREAVGDAADVQVRSVAVPLAHAPGKDVRVGAVVDLWLTPAQPESREPSDPQAADSQDAAPHQLAAGLTVAEVSSPGGAFSVGGDATVHVLVPTGALARVLGALASGGTVDVVPVPGSGG
jgi:hypothetical protein